MNQKFRIIIQKFLKPLQIMNNMNYIIMNLKKDEREKRKQNNSHIARVAKERV